MTYAAKIVADSRAFGTRLTSIEVTFPRFILAEFNTHRVFSRNSASSRAIPVERRIAQVRANPFVPEAFGKNKSGMQASADLGGWRATFARWIWLLASKCAVMLAWCMSKLGVHKQHANRLIEPFCWHTVIVTATEWENFFALRTDKAAQPEMQIAARLMRGAMDASTPRELGPGDWHLPYVEPSDRETAHAWAGAEGDCEPERLLLSMSVTRCAAVSFERQHAERSVREYSKRHDDLLAAGHMSPFEHQARVLDHAITNIAMFHGNFRTPWLQYRKTLAGEDVWRPR